jgi:hypothetical protein
VAREVAMRIGAMVCIVDINDLQGGYWVYPNEG